MGEEVSPGAPCRDASLGVADAAVALPSSGTNDCFIIVDGRIIDVSRLIHNHPGGHAVLLAHLGRDASADFHSVSAHVRPGVVRRLNDLTVGCAAAVSASRWSEFADYLILIRNAFGVQSFGAEGRPVALQNAYTVQTLAHLVGDHLPAFRQRLQAIAGLLGVAESTGADRGVAQELAPLVAGDARESGRLAGVCTSVLMLLGRLIEVARQGIDAERQSLANVHLAMRALTDIDDWLAALPQLLGVCSERTP